MLTGERMGRHLLRRDGPLFDGLDNLNVQGERQLFVEARKPLTTIPGWANLTGVTWIKRCVARRDFTQKMPSLVLSMYSSHSRPEQTNQTAHGCAKRPETDGHHRHARCETRWSTIPISAKSLCDGEFQGLGEISHQTFLSSQQAGDGHRSAVGGDSQRALARFGKASLSIRQVRLASAWFHGYFRYATLQLGQKQPAFLSPQ